MASKRIAIVSDFNVEPLARLMTNAPGYSDIAIDAAPFGQVYQQLGTNPEKDYWAKFVWTLPQRIIPSFAAAFNLEEVDYQQILREVDSFCDIILAAAEHCHIFVASWVLPSDYRGYGNLDWRPGLGLKFLLAEMNLQMAKKLSVASNIYILDAQRWQSAVANPEAARMWYAAKVPYVTSVMESASSDILKAIHAIGGTSRRLVIVDLDNTLWGGVVGETGWQGIRLGGHNYRDEAFKDFQRELKALSNRGVQLGIVSKNDEAVALEAIDQHSEMVLRRDDFAGWKINWKDKAENVAALVAELNLGLGSVVFIDDNPAERERVAGALPDVLVPDWPVDPTDYVGALRALDCFQTAAISREDRGRKAMYVAERDRRESMSSVASPEDWLQQLGTRLTVAPLEPGNLARVSQLFNKTNQLNLSTRRLSDNEITQWAAEPNRSLLAISVADNFGDMGLVGIVSIEKGEADGDLVDFVLSCRAMGRKVEEAMLRIAMDELEKLGGTSLNIRFLPTARNRPTLEVLEGAGLVQTAEHTYRMRLTDHYPFPGNIKLQDAAGRG